MMRLKSIKGSEEMTNREHFYKPYHAIQAASQLAEIINWNVKKREI